MSENEKLLLTLFSEEKAISYAFMRYRMSLYLMDLTKRHVDKFSSYQCLGLVHADPLIIRFLFSRPQKDSWYEERVQVKFGITHFFSLSMNRIYFCPSSGTPLFQIHTIHHVLGLRAEWKGKGWQKGHFSLPSVWSARVMSGGTAVPCNTRNHDHNSKSWYI